jgi:hypothetical protein
MEKVQLDKKTELELQDGEVVIFAHKVGHIKGPFMGRQVNFAITNKRIALVPYKAGEGTETINYADIAYAYVSNAMSDQSMGMFKLVMQEKTKLLGFIPAHKKMKFQLMGSLGESFALMLKDVGRELKKEAGNMMSIMDYQQRVQAIDSRGDLTSEQKGWAKTQAWSNASGEWAALFEKTAIYSKKPTPVQRMKLLVELVSEAKKNAK